MKFLFTFPIALMCWHIGWGQDLRDIYVDDTQNGKIFSEFLHELEAKYKVDFIFDEDRIQAFTVMGINERVKVLDYLATYLVHFHVTRISDRIAFIADKKVSEEYGRRRENYLVLREPEGTSTALAGLIQDSGTDDPIQGAQIYVPGVERGTFTDQTGHFQMTIPTGIHLIEIQYVGYETKFFILGFSPLSARTTISESIYPKSTELEVVTVTAQRIDANVREEISGTERMNIDVMKSLPSFLGEVDPIRSITTLPGVSTTGELSSGFNVRGGDTGQNLIMQDGAPIYNPSHLFGYFSAFNPDLVHSTQLYKGGGRASYGGRLSSVLEVKLRNGDAGRHALVGGFGPVASRLAVEGPIERGRSSYLLGARISQCNWLIHAVNNIPLKNSSARFHDVTGKIFKTVNNSNYLTLSIYQSYDDFQLASDSTFSWGTLNFSARWDHAFNDALSSAATAYNGNYFSSIISKDAIEGFTYRNAIASTGASYDLSYVPDERYQLGAGIQGVLVHVDPGKLVPADQSGNVDPQRMNRQQQFEAAVYIQAELQLSERWGLSSGLRFSNATRLGKDHIYLFEAQDLGVPDPTVLDTVEYSSLAVVSNFSGLEPRISLRFLITKASSLKASFYRTYQYLHLVSNTASTTPQDYWLTSGPYVKPESSNQYALGFFRNFNQNNYEFSVEGFYRQLNNVVDYTDGADLTLNPFLEAGLAQGTGEAYGLEILLKKSQGKFNGWLSYTYSRSFRNFDANKGYLRINDGITYPATYDKPNNLSVILNYELSDRAVLSTNFSYSTGRPITIPVSKFDYYTYLAVLNYSGRNEYRLPAYHRLDLSLTIRDRIKKNRRWMGEWVFSIVNLYGRDNAYSIFFDRYGKARKLSLIGTVFPSFNYNFKF